MTKWSNNVTELLNVATFTYRPNLINRVQSPVSPPVTTRSLMGCSTQARGKSGKYSFCKRRKTRKALPWVANALLECFAEKSLFCFCWSTTVGGLPSREGGERKPGNGDWTLFLRLPLYQGHPYKIQYNSLFNTSNCNNLSFSSSN